MQKQNTVKASVKKISAVFLFALALMAVKSQNGWAASTDTIQLLVTPSVLYSVTISSPDAGIGYDFGSVGLNTSTRTERAATVTNSGNISSFWQISASGQDSWSLGTSTGTQDVAVLKALFNTYNGATPTASQFNTVSGSTITAVGRTATQTIGLSTTTAMNSAITAGSQRDVFFMLHTPNGSSTATQQKFRVYITAVP